MSDLRIVVDALLDYKAREGAGIWKLDTPKADAALAELEMFAAEHHRVMLALLDATRRAERLEAAIRAQWSPEQAEAIIATAQGETADDGKIESFDHAALSGEDANVVGSALHVACYGPGLSLRKYETAKAALRRLSNLVCVSEQAQMILRRDQIIRERETDLTDANRRGHELDVENEELERALRAARAWVEKDRAGAEEWGTLEQVDAAEELLILIDAALGERDPT